MDKDRIAGVTQQTKGAAQVAGKIRNAVSRVKDALKP